MSIQDTQDTSAYAGPAPIGTALLFLAAIGVGSALGISLPETTEQFSRGIDATLLTLIFLLFFELRLSSVFRAFSNLRFLTLAWVANFLFVPAIALALASIFLGGQPLLFTGVMIYLLAPCTDWFLGFTRMAKGDTELGAALIPINLITQLFAFPLWLWLFTPHSGLVDLDMIPGALAQWFLVPLLAAQVLRFAAKRLLPDAMFGGLMNISGIALPAVIALLIMQLFASNVGIIADQIQVFTFVALTIVTFFAAILFACEALARIGRLSYGQRALLSMTMTARNAPMMLALTAVAVPDQPVILAVIIFGMLIEFPHLTAVKHLLLRSRAA